MESKRWREEWNGKWKTRDGRLIHITDMTDQHLRNTIKYVERTCDPQHKPWMQEKLEVMKKEVERRKKEGIMVRAQKKEDILIFGDE